MITAEMPSTREVLDTTIGLEKQSMLLYARFAKIFAEDRKLHEFWFGMARDEARHVGALDLVSTVLDLEGKLDQPSPIALDAATIDKLRLLHANFDAVAKPGLSIEHALGVAL